MGSRILFLGEDVVAVDKAPGVSLLTPPSKPAAGLSGLLASLSARDRARLAGETGLRLVHRLDVGTSGLVLLARGQEAHRRLTGLFAEGLVHREYLGVVWGRWPETVRQVDLPLGPEERDRRKMRPRPDGKRALTGVDILAAGSWASLLLFRPLTGRTHQIRVHAAASGHPLAGDDLYGTLRSLPPGLPTVLRRALPHRPLLHAHRLLLPDRAGEGGVRLEAPLPPDFRKALEVLGLPVP